MDILEGSCQKAIREVAELTADAHGISENVPYEDRTAHFVCSISCVFPDGREPITVTSSCDGIILRELRGENGFGYDPLFYYEPFGKTLAEMCAEEKNSISHRGRAIELLAKTLKEINEKE